MSNQNILQQKIKRGRKELLKVQCDLADLLALRRSVEKEMNKAERYE